MVFVQTRKAIVYSMNSNGPGRHKVVHLLASFAGNSYCNGYTDRHFLFSPHSPTCSLKEHSEARLQNSPYFCVFKYARAVKQKVWRVRLARFMRVRLLRHALPISLLILRKNPTVLQSTVKPAEEDNPAWRSCRRKSYPVRSQHSLKVRLFCSMYMFERF